MNEPILLSWSGGKDSALALEMLRSNPRWRIVGLLTSVDSDGHVRGQGIPHSILHRQAAQLGLPLFESPCVGMDNAAYEASLAATIAHLREGCPELRHVAFGDIFLADVRAYRESLLARHGMESVFPIWGQDTRLLARTFIARGHRAVVCRADTTQLDARFCGREFDHAFLLDLPSSCDPCGERGEFHTCLYAGPLFHEPVPLVGGACALRDGRFMCLDLRTA